jgi:hypothetical protein
VVTDPTPSPTDQQPPVGAATVTTVRHFLVQAPVPVMDVDGFRVTTLGLVVFAVASILAALFYPELKRDGNGWWLGVCISGFLLGLVGLGYCLFRRSRRRAGRWDRD